MSHSLYIKQYNILTNINLEFDKRYNNLNNIKGDAC